MISVVVPYYNDINFFKDCIDSILNQSFSNFELILLNHASTDGCAELAASYKDPRIKHIHFERNYGAGGGLLMEEFLNVATGKYYKPFCADDVMHADCLKNLYEYLENNPSVDVVFGDMRFVDDRLNPSTKTWWNTRSFKDINLSNIEILSYYLKGFSILPYPAAMCRTEVLRKITLDKILHAQFDMTIWVQLLINMRTIKCLPIEVCSYRIHSDQASSFARKNVVFNSSMFESIFYASYFINIKSVPMVKELLSNDTYAQLLNEDEEELISFVMARHYLHCPNHSYMVQGLLVFHQIMSNDRLRNKIETKFGYTVTDVRERCAKVCLFPSFQDINFYIFVITKIKIKIASIIKACKRPFFKELPII